MEADGERDMEDGFACGDRLAGKETTAFGFVDGGDVHLWFVCVRVCMCVCME